MNIAIGIPTYECGKSLVTTLNSIIANQVEREQIFLAVDGDQYKDRLQSLDLGNIKIKLYTPRQGQSARINDIFQESEAELLILSNDDVKWSDSAVASIVSIFQKTGADLITTNVVPLSAQSMEEQIINFGAAVSRRVVAEHNGGHSYLSCNGRLIALSRRLYKQIRIPTDIWNNDAYIYFAAILNGFKHEHCLGATCYYRSPVHLAEHFKQSVKFQVSQVDLQGHFSQSLTPYYDIPVFIQLKSFGAEWLKSPLVGSAYIAVLLWSKWKTLISPLKKTKLTYWETDASTKLI